jgi:hypothetical protein
MKFTCLNLLISLLCSGLASAQQAQIDLPLVVTNGFSARTLHFGLAPEATDAQDRLLGEFEVPPLPPAGAFEARFTTNHLGNDLQGQWSDYRQGTTLVSTRSLYRLKFQPAEGTTEVVFAYELPRGVSGHLVDRMGGMIVDHAMSGKGSYTLTRLVLNELDMEIFWNGDAGAEKPPVPQTFALDQNYPNPFNPSTTIHYAVPTAGQVTLRVFDVTGREVATLDEGTRQPGRYSVVWDASDVAGGVYFYRLTAPGFTETRSVVLLK